MESDTLTLATILTAGGAVAVSGLISGLIEMAKRLPSIGAWVGNGREFAFACALSAFFVVWAVLGGGQPLTPVSAFADFLAWYGIARLSGAVYDNASSAKAAVKAAIGGG